MKPGPRPQPTALKIARGNPGKENLDARVKQEPRPGVANLDPPEGLAGVALETWHDVVPILHSSGVLTAADEALVVKYCELRALYVEALTDVRHNGLVVDNPSGRKVANPAAVLVRGLHADLLRIEAELGLTPASRTGLVVGKRDPADDAFEAFIERGKAMRAGFLSDEQAAGRSWGSDNSKGEADFTTTEVPHG